LEKRQHTDFVTASFQDIYGQILSAATVTDTDGISLFTHHAIIYEPAKKFDLVQKSRAAVVDGLKAYELITSKVSSEPNRLALYVPYSDFVIERWNNYFLPALDAFRELGIPIDILPYAPRMDESVYPYYPIHHNEDVLARLIRERTVLVLANVSGFQQTDSDLIKAFVEQGGTIIAFGPQIPMGRTYERKDIFGIDESQATTRARVVVKGAIGDRVSAGREFTLGQTRLPTWTLTKGRVIATYEDSSPAITVNKYGKGTAITVLPDVAVAVQSMPDLVRDVLQYAELSAGNSVLVDVVGGNEKTDVAIKKTQNGFRVAFVNHNPDDLEILFRPVGRRSRLVSTWTDLVSNKKLPTTATDSSLRLKIPAGGFRLLQYGDASPR
jgi:hypothetical protein